MNFFAQPKLSLTQLLPTEGHMVMVIIIITKKSRPNSLLLLTGDFNVMSDGYENSKVTKEETITINDDRSILQAIRYLTGQLETSPVVLVDTFRVVKIASSSSLTNKHQFQYFLILIN